MAAALSQPRQPYDKRTYNDSNPPKVAIMANICLHLPKPVSSQQQLVTAPSCDHFQLISKFSKLKHEFCCKISLLQMLTLPSFAKRNIFNFSSLSFRDNPVFMCFCCQTMTYVEVCLEILDLICHKEKSECSLLPD